MKTAHQLARELLAGPDLPIAICDPHAEEREDVCCDPIVALVEGFDDDGEPSEMLELFGKGIAAVLAEISIEPPDHLPHGGLPEVTGGNTVVDGDNLGR